MTALTIPSCDDAPNLLNKWALQIKDSHPQKTDELFLLGRLFEKSNGNLPLAFPLTVELSEKPDFIVAHGGIRIGVEVTQFRAEQLARAEHLASQNESGMVITPFDFDSPRRSNEDILKRMQGHQVGLDDWVEIGGRVDTHTKKLTEIIESKTHKIVTQATSLLDEYWLVVEDRMYLSESQITKMIPRVWHFLSEREGSQTFDLVLFVLMEKILGFRRNKQRHDIGV